MLCNSVCFVELTVSSSRRGTSQSTIITPPAPTKTVFVCSHHQTRSPAKPSVKYCQSEPERHVSACATYAPSSQKIADKPILACTMSCAYAGKIGRPMSKTDIPRASPEVIILFFWYSHLFHNNTCKVTRGKHDINAF
jgi:hypothetical protein